MEENILGGALMSDQVLARLLDDLRRGRFAQADRLPAELDLAQQMGVSRTVIRDAMAELERSGYIERVRGIGTVVNRDALTLRNRMDHKLEYYDMIQALGQEPHSDSLTVTRDQAKPLVAKRLGLQPGDPVIKLSKRVLAGSTPVLYSIDYLSPTLFGENQPQDMDFNCNIFDLLHNAGIQVVSTVSHVKASAGTVAIRNALQLPPSEALLLLDEVAYTRLCRPVFHSYAYYTNFFDFSIIRKKL